MMQSISLLSRSSLYRRVVTTLSPAISFESEWRPSQRSAAATHSTPGSCTAFVSRPEPCIPMPMMPKRTRSLGEVGCKGRGMCSGSRKILGEAASAPVAPALRRRNLRRDRSFLMSSSWRKLQVASSESKLEARPKINCSHQVCSNCGPKKPKQKRYIEDQAAGTDYLYREWDDT